MSNTPSRSTPHVPNSCGRAINLQVLGARLTGRPARQAHDHILGLMTPTAHLPARNRGEPPPGWLAALRSDAHECALPELRRNRRTRPCRDDAGSPRRSRLSCGTCCSGLASRTAVTRPRAADLFCGAGGLSVGLTDAGYDVVLGVDSDPVALESYARGCTPALTLCRRPNRSGGCQTR